MKIYVCGNPLVKEDSLPLKIIESLREQNPEVEFIEYEPTEELPEEKELVILDTVINAKNVIIVEDVDKFASQKALSLHDFDLGWNLKLAKKAGKINRVKIIGVPPYIDEKEAVKKINEIIASLS